ncbi:MBL fold metallo-hydrolase [Jeotgalibacillus soli]|uniref:Beta-lactamase n=1 Tax=Jeotgalibacillus soli TaxID=889306 RepID=A0A0C2VYG3_9BACL|nr:MBL fold metallo-hydrolase [Jeotgalibacillus soli]KIL49446.1 beta-lactamase [Jeotgalibacillus soli]
MGRKYTNLDNVSTLKTFSELLAWRKERASKEKDLSYQVPQEEEKQLSFLQQNRLETTITWIGHASFLLQVDGVNILCDPVWAEKMGFDRRLAKPGLALGELPQIDVVLISHGHYDHLDMPTLNKLAGPPLFLVPEGMKRMLKRRGFKRVIELRWWEKQQVSSIEISFVPAQHWTRRALFDTNRSHWGGWVLQPKDEKAIYFAGDSGYFSGFQDIGQRFEIGYALLPIGAYEPEWFMSSQHTTPEEAIQAFLDTNADTMIPMHYGSFRLADDTPKEALDRLYEDWQKRGLNADNLRVLLHGETVRSNK